MILPGTRTTIRALDWLRACGFAELLARLATGPDSPYILGLCGGCQLLGKTIHDPEGVESDATNAEGLGLLDLDTLFEVRKSLYRVEGEVIAPGSLCHGCPVLGYEVHQGVSQRRSGAAPWLRLRRHNGETVEDGAVSPEGEGRVCGTYVHGLFDDARFCRSLVAALRRRRGLPQLADGEWLSQREFWAKRYHRLAGWLAEHCDLRPVAAALGLPCKI